jgi:hypothetical protein
MQARIERAKTVSGVRSVGRFAILAGVPLIATLALSAPDRAFAGACGGASHPAHAASTSGGSVHTATGIPPTSGGGVGGGGSGGCANGSSAAPLHGLATAGSGRVIENVAHPGTHTKTATTRTANTNLHSRVARPQHRA